GPAPAAGRRGGGGARPTARAGAGPPPRARAAPPRRHPATPDWLIHDRSSTVLPLPAGADTTITRARAPSRPTSRGRATTPPAPGPAAPPATAPAPTADPMVPIIASRQPTWPRSRAGQC